MNEADWLTCEQPPLMVEFLRAIGQLTARKARLFAVACCRRIWSLLLDARSRRAVEAAEAFADGQIGIEELTAAYDAANVACNATDPTDKSYYVAASLAREVAYTLPRPGCSCVSVAAAAVGDAVADPTTAARAYTAARAEELARQCHLVRDLFGNPFRPVSVDPSWRTATVVALAQVTYDERKWQEMAVLGDTLEASGCRDQVILAHCRSSESHARGCWVCDLWL